jgi:hypothetical protein
LERPTGEGQMTMTFGIAEILLLIIVIELAIMLIRRI